MTGPGSAGLAAPPGGVGRPGVLGAAVVVGHRRLVRTGRPRSWPRRRDRHLRWGGRRWWVALGGRSVTSPPTGRSRRSSSSGCPAGGGGPTPVRPPLRHPSVADPAGPGRHGPDRLARPPVAIVTVSAGAARCRRWWSRRARAVGPGLLARRSSWSGLVLWIPVLGRIPGLRASTAGDAVRLPGGSGSHPGLPFLPLHPFDPTAVPGVRQVAAIGLRPLNDQQVAGFVSKLSMLLVLLTVGAVVLARAPDPTTSSTRGPPGVGRRRAAVRAGRPAGRGGTGPVGGSSGRAGPATPAARPGPAGRGRGRSITDPSPDDDRSDHSKGGAEPRTARNPNDDPPTGMHGSLVVGSVAWSSDPRSARGADVPTARHRIGTGRRRGTR